MTSSLDALRRKIGGSFQSGERPLGQVALEPRPRPRILADQPARPLPGGLPPGARFDHARVHTLAERVPATAVTLVLTDRRLLVLTTSFLVTKVATAYALTEVLELGLRPLQGKSQVVVRFADSSIVVRPAVTGRQAEAFVEAFRSLGPVSQVAVFVDPAFLE